MRLISKHMRAPAAIGMIVLSVLCAMCMFGQVPDELGGNRGIAPVRSGR